MAVTHCYLCERNKAEGRQFGTTGYENGEICPLCHRSTCRHHLVTVRWRWRTPAREAGAVQICRECKRGFKHREWDPHNREWIT